MCPDEETLSAFIDNEIEGRFNNVIKNHIDGCKECNAKAESFISLRTLFYDELPLEKIKDAEEKVWDKIEFFVESKTKPDIWHRRIAIPLPVMAAAVLILVSTVLSFYFISFNKFNSSEPAFNFSESISFDKEEDFRLFETDQVLDVDLTLPESTIFMISGTPKLIREVDYLNNNR